MDFLDKPFQEENKQESKQKLFSQIKNGTFLRTTSGDVFVIINLYSTNIDYLEPLHSEEKFFKNHVVDIYDVTRNKSVITFIMYDYVADSIYFSIELASGSMFHTLEIEELL